jgi:hypothetical protein
MKCKTCNNLIKSKIAKIFCSRSCAAKFNNSKSPKRKKESGTFTNCLNCNKQFYYYSYNSAGKFCCGSCHQKYKNITDTIPRIENGECRESVTLRKYLIAKRGNKCEICGVVDWNNKSLSLHVDHIDGNSDNNLPINLRLLCPNCHSQTETFCGRNKKNTKRSIYNQRYRTKKLSAQ